MHAVRRIVVSYIRYASQRQACITFLTSYKRVQAFGFEAATRCDGFTCLLHA